MKTLKMMLPILVVCIVFTSCSVAGTYPKMTDELATQILSDLIPKSIELNDIFFGKGLKTDEHEESLYNDGADYRKVSDSAKYTSIDEIKNAAKMVYTSAYLKGVYVTAFEGYTDTDVLEQVTENKEETITEETVNDDDARKKENHISPNQYNIQPRYIEQKGILYEDINFKEYNLQTSFDISTVKVISQKYENVIVEIEYTLKEKKDKVKLILVYENDRWLLDSPTY